MTNSVNQFEFSMKENRKKQSTSASGQTNRTFISEEEEEKSENLKNEITITTFL